MSRPDWDSWCYSTLDELDGMETMDVFSKRWFTLDELRKKGIKNRPMPVGLIYDIKRDPSDGEISILVAFATKIVKQHP
jgi:hypothetical protein